MLKMFLLIMNDGVLMSRNVKVIEMRRFHGVSVHVRSRSFRSILSAAIQSDRGCSRSPV